MRFSAFNEEVLSLKEIDALLFNGLTDDGAAGDVIFVFGSQKALIYRAPEAIRLYKKKRAPKILFSGGVHWDGQTAAEAVLMAKEAIKQGVPEEDILIEDQSKNTLQNVLFSRDVLDREIGLQRIHRILIVTTAYHMRRCHLTMITHMPESISYTFCPVDDRNTRRDNWFHNEKGTARAKAECKKIITYVRSGQLRDMEVEVL